MVMSGIENVNISQESKFETTLIEAVIYSFDDLVFITDNDSEKIIAANLRAKEEFGDIAGLSYSEAVQKEFFKIIEDLSPNEQVKTSKVFNSISQKSYLVKENIINWYDDKQLVLHIYSEDNLENKRNDVLSF